MLGKTLRIFLIILLTVILLGLNKQAVFGQTVSPAGNQSSEEQLAPTLTPTPLVVKEEPLSGINLTVSPIFINLYTNPGEEVSSQIKVKNNNNYTEYLEVNLAKYVPSGQGKPVLADLTEEDEFQNWISFSQKQFELAANESQTVKVTVSPPESAALGYYYALVINRIKEREGEGGSTVVSGAPAISLLLEVKSPNAIKELQLIDFKTDRFIYEYLPAKFKVRTKNTGNIHVVPFGDIFIDWGSKEDLASLQINSGRGNVLPDSEREFITNWKDGFIVRQPKKVDGQIIYDKKGEPVYETNLDWSKVDRFRIGKYTAHLLMIYDNGERDIPVESRTSFWVIPYKIIGGALVIAGLVVFGLRAVFMGIIKGLRRKVGNNEKNKKDT